MIDELKIGMTVETLVELYYSDVDCLEEDWVNTFVNDGFYIDTEGRILIPVGTKMIYKGEEDRRGMDMFTIGSNDYEFSEIEFEDLKEII